MERITARGVVEISPLLTTERGERLADDDLFQRFRKARTQAGVGFQFRDLPRVSPENAWCNVRLEKVQALP